MTGGKYMTEETRIGLLHAALEAYKQSDFAKRDEILQFLASNSKYGFVDSQNQMFGIMEVEPYDVLLAKLKSERSVLQPFC
jgi:hypothetical protein